MWRGTWAGDIFGESEGEREGTGEVKRVESGEQRKGERWEGNRECKSPSCRDAAHVVRFLGMLVCGA